MTQLATGWNLEVDRGPEWLIVRLAHDGSSLGQDVSFAEAAWNAMQQHFAQRIVLDLHEVPLIHSFLVGQLVLLHKRVTSGGGIMRVCGLTPTNESVLHTARLHDRFPNYESCEAAMHGHLPNKPR